MAHDAGAMNRHEQPDEDEDKFEERFRRQQRAARGAADGSLAALIQVGTGIASGLTAAASASPVIGVLVGGFVRLGAEFIKNGVAAHKLGQIFAFLREVEREAGPQRPSAAAIAESFRHAMGALDEAVYPALARLIAEYGARKPDAFFRGVGEVLAALDEAGLASLQSLIAVLLEEMDSDQPARGNYFVFEVQLSPHGDVVLEVGWGSPGSVDFHSVGARLPPSADRWHVGL